MSLFPVLADIISAPFFFCPFTCSKPKGLYFCKDLCSRSFHRLSNYQNFTKTNLESNAELLKLQTMFLRKRIPQFGLLSMIPLPYFCSSSLIYLFIGF